MNRLVGMKKNGRLKADRRTQIRMQASAHI